MPEPPIYFVILMGVGIVFIGLICIILLSMAMSAICRSMGDKTTAPAPAAAAPAAPAAQAEAIPNRQAVMLATKNKRIPVVKLIILLIQHIELKTIDNKTLI